MTSAQQTLDFTPPIAESPAASDLRARADAFMAKHPEVLNLFIRYGRAAMRSGQRIGAKAIAERVRWECVLERGDREYKLNNNLVAYLARAMVDRDPRLGGMLRFRRTQW